MYGPNNAHLKNYSQDGNFDISKAAIRSLSLQTMCFMLIISVFTNYGLRILLLQL
jgi:hypothetical protein